MYPTGTHLIVGRGVYTHHGIFVGRNRVIHYSGMGSGLHKGCIESTSLEAFLQGKNARIKTYRKVYFRGPEICRRARSRLGEDQYNLVFNNCEHFANWCATDRHTSEQIDAATQRLGTAAATHLLMRQLTKQTAEQTTKALLTQGSAAIARKMLAGQAASTAATQVARSLTSQALAKGVVSTTSGLAAAGGTSSLTAASLSAVGLAGGTALAPALATVAVAAGAAYLVGSFWDWLTD
ncbi:lecithin retinol acyltransferase family protein [Pseudomonas chlororaphis]|uniref:lecithin retinol acyltransferase family protein n=1 Tax=Pseudomonas chlororaphis TaxID=587753 RepID=UPI00346235A8